MEMKADSPNVLNANDFIERTERLDYIVDAKNEYEDQLINEQTSNYVNHKPSNNSVENFQLTKREKKRKREKKKYLHFNLYKENKDICEILNKIKLCLHKKPSDISYCGIKDKRGITVQKFCISKTKKEDLLKLIMKNEKWFNNVFISNIEYKKRKLALGNLKGNYFKILIRGVDNDAYQKCQVLCENLKKYGFVNYFGEQRFGNRNVKNYEIGMKILKKEYKEAILLCVPNVELDTEGQQILSNYINAISDEDDVSKMKHDYNGGHYIGKKRAHKKREKNAKWNKKNQKKEEDKTQVEEEVKTKLEYTEQIKNGKKNEKTDDLLNFERVVNSISKKIYVERVILNALKECRNFKNAFMSIPKDIFSLFIHSTQSLIFNILANIRMKKYGMQVTPGDLVQVGEEDEEWEDEDEDEEEEEEEEEKEGEGEGDGEGEEEATEEEKNKEKNKEKDENEQKEVEQKDTFKLTCNNFKKGINKCKKKVKGNSNNCEENRKCINEFSLTHLENSPSNICNNNNKKKNTQNENNQTDDEQKKKKIIVVTENNIHMFNIYDVVLPLPGDRNIIYPQNLMEEYENVLKHFNLSFENFKSDKSFFTASGCFRKIVVKPSNVKLIFMPNESRHMTDIPMLKSDLFRLRENMQGENNMKEIETEMEKEKEMEMERKRERKRERENKTENVAKKTAETTTSSSFVNTNEELNELEDNIIFSSDDQHHEYLIKNVPNYQFKSSIFFTCTLPKSSYITVALREVLNNIEN